MSNSFNGQRLRQARLYKGLSINDLAELLGVSKQAISQYETSNVTPDFDKMRIITNKLNFPSSYFFKKIVLMLIPEQHISELCYRQIKMQDCNKS